MYQIGYCNYPLLGIFITFPSKNITLHSLLRYIHIQVIKAARLNECPNHTTLVKTRTGHHHHCSCYDHKELEATN